MTEAKILEFLDGRLGGADEEELLHLLAVSPERRMMLRSHMQLREAMNGLQYSEKFAVPCALTSSVFAQLASEGFSAAPNSALPNAVVRLAPNLVERIALPLAGFTAGAGAAIVEEEKRGFPIFGWLKIGAVAAVSFMAGLGSLYVYDHSSGAQDAEMIQNLPPEYSATATPASLRSESVASASERAAASERTSASERAAASERTSASERMEYRELAVGRTSSPELNIAKAIRPASVNTVNAEESAALVENSDAAESDLVSDGAVHSVRSVISEPAASIATPPIAIVTPPVSAKSSNFGSAHQGLFAASTPTLGLPVYRQEHDWSVSHIDVASPYWLMQVQALDPVEYQIGPVRSSDVGSQTTPMTIRELSILSNGEQWRMSPLSLSLRAAGGPILQRTGFYSASFSEIRLNWRIGNWLVARAGAGQLLPYESEAEFAGVQGGVAQLRSVRTLKFIPVVGGGLAVPFDAIGLPIELGVSLYSDMGSMIYPKAELNANVALSHNISLLMGLEAMIYQHSIDPSLENLRYIYRRVNPAVRGTIDHNEWDGYIGPSVEVAWHF